MAESWLKKIAALKRLIREVGPLWPKSTKLAGFASDGPYFCGMCEYMKRDKDGQIIKDEKGFGRCKQSVMIADPELEKYKFGLPIIQDSDKQCCEWVDRFKKESL